MGYEEAAENVTAEVTRDHGRVVEEPSLRSLSTLKPLGQLRDSFILAVNEEGLWIVDQHVAHERVLFEKILRERETEGVQRQRLLMPLLVDLLPAQMVAFARIAEELERNGFEAEPFGPRDAGGERRLQWGWRGGSWEAMLEDVLSVEDRLGQVENAGGEAAKDSGEHGVSCGNQDQYAAGAGKDRVAAGGVGEDGASDELSAWAADCTQVFL